MLCDLNGGRKAFTHSAGQPERVRDISPRKATNTILDLVKNRLKLGRGWRSQKGIFYAFFYVVSQPLTVLCYSNIPIFHSMIIFLTVFLFFKPVYTASPLVASLLTVTL